MAIVRIPFDTTTNKDLLKTGALRQIFDNTVREAKTEYQVLCNDLKTSDEYERDVEMSGLIEAVEVTEGQNIPIQAPTLGSTKTYNQRQFGAGFRMTFKMDYFNKYSLWKRWARDLGKIQKESKDIEIAVMFNDTDSTSLTCGTGFDSAALADATHDNPSAAIATYSNTGDAAMSITAIQAARYYFATLLDSNGKWVGAVPTVIYYHPTLHFTVNEIFGSELKAHELSNTINILGDMKLKLFEYHRLDTATDWGMAAPNDPDYDINVFTSMEPRMFEKSAPDNTLDKMMISLQMFTYGWGDPRLFYVGKGD